MDSGPQLDLQANAQQTLAYLQSTTPNGEGYGFCDANRFSSL